MSEQAFVPRGPLDVKPGRRLREVIGADGVMIPVPDGWDLLPPGDAFLTRRVKAAGPCLCVSEIVRNKKFSRGIWAPAETIAAARTEVDARRDDPVYRHKLEGDRARREAKELVYADQFRQAVLTFLAFHPVYAAVAETLADRVARHAVPVGSGTVARTERIPIERRAEAAVIAWMRHATTAYDSLPVARVKGARRELRRELAGRSRQLLGNYRTGAPVDPARCPLALALAEKA